MAFCPRVPLTSILPICLSILVAGCGGGSGGGVSSRAVTAPASVMSGQALAWAVSAGVYETFDSTVYDSSNAVVYHRGFGADPAFAWTPYQPDNYFIVVNVYDGGAAVAQGQTLVDVLPRGGPTVTGTTHPLVAHYSFEVPAGRQGRVSYTCESCPPEVVARMFETPVVEGRGGEAGVLLAGLRPSSMYQVWHTILDGDVIVERGPMLAYTSGELSVDLPVVDVLSAPVNPGVNSILALSGAGSPSFIVDELGTPVWYAPFGAINRPTGTGWTILEPHVMSVVDYTGQALRSVGVDAINTQLDALGFPRTLAFHHEIRPLPGGRFAVLGAYDRLLADVQGPGEVDVLGETVIVVDDQMRVVWTWDSFEHLDVARAALLNDTIETGFLGLNLQFGDEANDWTHSNSIDYDPRDGNLLVSVRNQDWVVKIAYEDGAGDGRIVWRVGTDGDLSIVATDPDPWFSYQHDANVLADGRLAIYDNGNVRVTNKGGNSRGQVYILDETARQAALDVNVDLGVYSPALGSAAMAPDGAYHFNSGVLGVHDTVAADGFVHSSFSSGAFVYRSFRMGDPYDTSPN